MSWRLSSWPGRALTIWWLLQVPLASLTTWKQSSTRLFQNIRGRTELVMLTRRRAATPQSKWATYPCIVRVYPSLASSYFYHEWLYAGFFCQWWHWGEWRREDRLQLWQRALCLSLQVNNFYPACALRVLGLLLADGTPTGGRGEDFLNRQPDFFTETAVTPERKVEKSFPRWEINRHVEG